MGFIVVTNMCLFRGSTEWTREKIRLAVDGIESYNATTYDGQALTAITMKRDGTVRLVVETEEQIDQLVADAGRPVSVWAE